MVESRSLSDDSLRLLSDNFVRVHALPIDAEMPNKDEHQSRAETPDPCKAGVGPPTSHNSQLRWPSLGNLELTAQTRIRAATPLPEIHIELSKETENELNQTAVITIDPHSAVLGQPGTPGRDAPAQPTEGARGGKAWSPKQWLFFAAVLATGADYCGLALLMPSLPFYLEELDVSSEDDIAHWNSAITTSQFMAVVIGNLAWGLVGDRRALQLALVGDMVFFALSSFLHSPMSLIIVHLLVGLSTLLTPALLMHFRMGHLASIRSQRSWPVHAHRQPCILHRQHCGLSGLQQDQIPQH